MISLITYIFICTQLLQKSSPSVALSQRRGWGMSFYPAGQSETHHLPSNGWKKGKQTRIRVIASRMYRMYTLKHNIDEWNVSRYIQTKGQFRRVGYPDTMTVSDKPNSFANRCTGFTLRVKVEYHVCLSSLLTNMKKCENVFVSISGKNIRRLYPFVVKANITIWILMSVISHPGMLENVKSLTIHTVSRQRESGPCSYWWKTQYPWQWQLCH